MSVTWVRRSSLNLEFNLIDLRSNRQRPRISLEVSFALLIKRFSLWSYSLRGFVVLDAGEVSFTRNSLGADREEKRVSEASDKAWTITTTILADAVLRLGIEFEAMTALRRSSKYELSVGKNDLYGSHATYNFCELVSPDEWIDGCTVDIYTKDKIWTVITGVEGCKFLSAFLS